MCLWRWVWSPRCRWGAVAVLDMKLCGISRRVWSVEGAACGAEARRALGVTKTRDPTREVGRCVRVCVCCVCVCVW